MLIFCNCRWFLEVQGEFESSESALIHDRITTKSAAFRLGIRSLKCIRLGSIIYMVSTLIVPQSSTVIELVAIGQTSVRLGRY